MTKNENDISIAANGTNHDHHILVQNIAIERKDKDKTQKKKKSHFNYWLAGP